MKGGHFETWSYNDYSHQWGWSTDNSFTTTELDAGHVRFVQDGTNTKPSFLIKADDGSWVNGNSDNVAGNITFIANHAPQIETDDFHIRQTTDYHGDVKTTVSNLSMFDSDAGQYETFSFKVTANGHTLDRDSGSLWSINRDLDRGFAYTDYNPSATSVGKVAVTVTDGDGISDTVNFVFSTSNESKTTPLTLSGGPGKDVIIASNHNDTLIGGDSADQFVFASGTGHDTIKDFQSGTDKIDLQFSISYGPHDHSFADWLQNHTTHSSEGTVVHLDPIGAHDSNTILLKGLSSVQASDFIVHPYSGAA